MGRSPPGDRPAGERGRGGAVAPAGPAAAAGPALWDDGSPLSGCRSAHALCRVRGWNKHLPGRLLGALPKRNRINRLQRLDQELLVCLWWHVEVKSPATRSRWQWTWVGDDSLFKKYGQQLGLVGIG